MKKNNLLYFKHWLPNSLIKYWEKNKINNDFVGTNGLIIYEKNNKKIWGKTVTASNDHLPFGEKKYNDEYLEKVVFRGAEHPIGQLFKNLHDNGINHVFTAQDKVQILYFWLILILRNKFTIHKFSICLENLLKQHIDKHESIKHYLKGMEIEYFKYEIKNGLEVSSINKIELKNKEQFINFINSEGFSQFAKDVYWRFTNEILVHSNDVLNSKMNGEESTLKKILYYIDKQFTFVPLHEDEYLMLSDYPCFTFSIQNNSLVPINFDANFFNNEYIKIITDDEPNRDKKFSISDLLNFDFFFIPISPNYVMFFHKKDLNVDIINNHIFNFLNKNKLSKKRIEKFNGLGCLDKLSEFYFVMAIAQSREHIIIPKENFADKISEFLTDEALFLEKIEAFNKLKKIDYFASLEKKQVHFSNYNPNASQKHSKLKTEWFNIKSNFFKKVSKKKAKKHIENSPGAQYLQKLLQEGRHNELKDYLVTKMTEGYLIEKKAK